MNTQQTREFILAGNALFTLKSLKTEKHFTFKVVRKVDFENKPVSPATWLVKSLRGQDNTNSRNYHYIGSIRDGHFAYNTTCGTAMSTRGFAWCWKNLERCGERFELFHAGRCGRCGRLLTTPESVAIGIGPECADKLEFEARGGTQGLLSQLFGG